MSVVTDLFGGGGDAGLGDSGAISQAAIDELKRVFGLVEEDVQGAIGLGQSQIPAVGQGATIGGFDQSLEDIANSAIFGTLVGERTRGVEGALSAGGFTRSGEAIEQLSAIPQDILLSIEQLISGRQTDLFKTGLDASLNLGGLGIQGATAQGNIASSQAQRSFLGSQAALDRSTGAFSGLIGGAGDILSARGSARVAEGLSFFSDPILKENIEKIGKVGSLNLYQWDWIRETASTFVSKLPTVGFISTEVKKLYPEFVGKVFGFDCIDYHSVLNRIEHENELLAA